MYQNLKKWILWTATLAAISGCDSRVTQVAREAANRQAQQNTVMAELHQEVAAGAHELVAADAKARGDIVGVHHDLQSERTRLDTGWSALETERRQIASQRRTDSLMAALAPLVTGTVLVIVLLGFCWYAVGKSHASEGRDFVLDDFLVREILPDEPVLFGSAARDQLPRPAETDRR